ncbi:MAG: type II secretion system F family protein [Micromonosporaceae bacterium]
MSAPSWAAVGIAAAAIALGLPGRPARRRWRRLTWRRSGPAHAAPVRALSWPTAAALRTAVVLATAVAVLGFGLAGPVAGVVAAAYAGAAVALASGRVRARAESRSRARAVDAVASLAADLRAGVPVGPALTDAAAALTPVPSTRDGAGPIRRRVAAAVELAELSGAPLADVLDRLDADLRAADRIRAGAAAQAAGARASAWLLAAMPVAGVLLGYAVGTDPVQVLLHTPLGAACAITAVLLQLGGLAWSDRLARVEVAQ